MALRILTWNLLHGRAVPGAGRDLLEEFVAGLAAWSWDVALLQEVPPWWPPQLGERLHADARLVLTSRNALLPLRRAVAVRWPDLIKSNGGGCNAILARDREIVAHRTLCLARTPERRWLQAAALPEGVWVGNLHASVRDDAGARAEAALAARTLTQWAGEAPAVLGGDFNVRGLTLPGFGLAACHDVDMVFTRELASVSEAEVLERGRLSDHAPVAITLGGDRRSVSGRP
ncbi:MAG: endonuclease/exonuclease/phosphatase family protein [Actinomycetota bacterium]|nr:endonuclease/exonuclease/phosphatase family protein [Actinomycetota bacterium]